MVTASRSILASFKVMSYPISLEVEETATEDVAALAEADSMGLSLLCLLPLQRDCPPPPPCCLCSSWPHKALHPGDDQPGVGSDGHQGHLALQATHQLRLLSHQASHLSTPPWLLPSNTKTCLSYGLDEGVHRLASLSLDTKAPPLNSSKRSKAPLHRTFSLELASSSLWSTTVFGVK